MLIEDHTGWGGGLSEHVVVPRAAVYEIPDAVSLEAGGMACVQLPGRLV